MKKTAKILVVEDEALTAVMINEFLEASGYSICAPVSTGEAAILAVNDEKPDLVLMDIHLSGKIDGIAAASKIKTVSSIPIVFMSGYSSDSTQTRAYEIEPAGYLVKPLKLSSILSILNNLFPG